MIMKQLVQSHAQQIKMCKSSLAIPGYCGFSERAARQGIEDFPSSAEEIE
jgi:bacterioferritin-associated ferredoxin